MKDAEAANIWNQRPMRVEHHVTAVVKTYELSPEHPWFLAMHSHLTRTVPMAERSERSFLWWWEG